MVFWFVINKLIEFTRHYFKQSNQTHLRECQVEFVRRAVNLKLKALLEITQHSTAECDLYGLVSIRHDNTL